MHQNSWVASASPRTHWRTYSVSQTPWLVGKDLPLLPSPPPRTPPRLSPSGFELALFLNVDFVPTPLTTVGCRIATAWLLVSDCSGITCVWVSSENARLWSGVASVGEVRSASRLLLRRRHLSTAVSLAVDQPTDYTVSHWSTTPGAELTRPGPTYDVGETSDRPLWHRCALSSLTAAYPFDVHCCHMGTAI